MCESSKSSLYHIYLLYLKKMSVPMDTVDAFVVKQKICL
jgi:hypothetical protein